MKTLEELAAIRLETLNKINLRKDNDGTRVVVGMATCGIAAGARPVMLKFLEEVQKHELENVIVTQTGCIGLCSYEPIVEVYIGDEEKVTYINIDAKKAERIVGEHLISRHVVEEYTISSLNK